MGGRWGRVGEGRKMGDECKGGTEGVRTGLRVESVDVQGAEGV